ncbi:hypothetical protein FLJC2902T_14530 [Flavobacterium limnosediminis JC2902]|uniref:Lipoprotein n=1 Tax=Flavobacterium limnosediminis JC2902 TaxID=1341181 RepID=V6SQE3_9FLAO|nr:hypothetical protein [Flavobacterium limnosediminis]ESU28856.1 hypothetical protein FLJC2902T_14530 [Flavobacterium limnosediminis JC2902]
MKNSIAIRNWKSLGFCLALFAGLFIFSCESDDDLPPDTTATKVPYVCTSCATTSEALPENDNVSRGIYKGVFSAGTLVINNRNNAEKVTGKVYYKNKTINLQESPEVVMVQGRPTYLSLRGSSGGTNVTLLFSVNEDGSSPLIEELTISGERNITSFAVFKEKSNTLIEAYEGNYFLVNGAISTSDEVSEISERVDSGLGVPENAIKVGGLRMVLSRSESMWVLLKVMGDNENSVMDRGIIKNVSLVSDANGKTVANLSGDELNHSEYVSSGTLVMHAERKR